MREIKFRAWVENLKRILPVVSIDQDGRMIVSIRDLTKKEQSSAGFHDQQSAVYWYGKNGGGNSLLQFTGLKDKNSKEIYEGDVVTCYDTAGGLVYNHEIKLPEFYREIWSETTWDDKDKIRTDITKVEIIGNKYETPELLTNR